MRCILIGFVIMVFLTAIASLLIGQNRPVEADSADAADPSWDLSTAVYFYSFPDDDSFIMPILYATHGRLHLEARYNYEDSRSLSVFAGHSFSIGEELQLEVIPMMGGVIGNTLGIIPALEFDLVYWNLELYSEAEYVVDLRDQQSNYFYNWTELNYYPLNWLQLGVTSQQTREAEANWLIESGILAGASYSDYSGVFYLFNPGSDDRFYIFSLEINF